MYVYLPLINNCIHFKLIFIIFCLSRNIPPASALQMLQIYFSNGTHGIFQSSSSAYLQPENEIFSLLVKFVKCDYNK